MIKPGKLIRALLTVYRWLIYKIFGRLHHQVMPVGVPCQICTSDVSFEKYQGDVVHPCVRYCDNPFRGYNWWMVYTPYYKANAQLENPILCYGESEGNEAPRVWHIERLIRDTPAIGYNSDPTMLFSSGGLNIFWRENDTHRTQKDNFYRATYGLHLNEKDIQDFEKPILGEKDNYFDKEVSPTILTQGDRYLAYAAHVRFKNKRIHFKNTFIDKVTSIIAKSLSVVELYNEQKSYGIAIYESPLNEFNFTYKKTVKISNCNLLYRPWHFDFFEYDNKLYSIVQSNQFNADICLAVSDDYENFSMFKKPLITQYSIQKAGIYKPTAIVQNDIFHLYYTAQDKENRSLNKMYYSSISMRELLERLKN